MCPTLYRDAAARLEAAKLTPIERAALDCELHRVPRAEVARRLNVDRSTLTKAGHRALAKLAKAAPGVRI